jgi:diguanylate cyclase (GGDEF)-like protein
MTPPPESRPHEEPVNVYRKLQDLLETLQFSMARGQRAHADVARLSTFGADLAELAREFNTIDIDRILDAAVARVPALFGARYGAVYLSNPARGDISLARHSSADLPEDRIDPEKDADTLVAITVRKERPQAMQDAAEFQRRNDLALRVTPLTERLKNGCLLLPLMRAASSSGPRGAFGVLALADRESGAAFTAEETAAASLAAELFSAALSTCYLLDEMRRLATTDGLTRLLNHHLLNELTQKEISRFRRYGGSFSFALLDIDQFRRFNDQFGHAAGDRMIQEVARTVHEGLRSGIDIAARQEGTTFAIVLPETDLAGAVTAAHRVRRAIECLVFEDEGNTVAVTASFGVVEYREEDGPRGLVARAGRALAAAKAAGRNRVFVEDKGQVKDHA